MKKLIFPALIVPLVLVLVSVGQEQKKEDAITGLRFAIESKPQQEAIEGLTVTKRYTRRLPNYYKDVVSDDQRDKIYQIQQAYHPVVAMLELRLEQLKKERDLIIECVLSESQKSEIAAAEKEAAKERAAKKNAK